MSEAPLSPLKRALLAVDTMQARLAAAERAKREPIAVVGLGCRFPGANSPEAFWQLLCDGVDAITEVPEDRWEAERWYDPDPDVSGKAATRWGGFLDGIDQFDPAFFGIAPREATRMDPQQRLLLEVAYEALESAGVRLEDVAGSPAGVFIGAISSAVDYNWLQCQDPTYIDTYTASGTAHSIFSNRLSYLLDLRGPSLTVDTACSSSLTALHLAVRSLRGGECDLALAGGVHLLLAPESTVALSRMRMMAPDGRCKTFDAAADGFVRGEGCGLVVLKRLTDAVEDGDPILALIRGSAVNQDGSTNGITAPNGLAQQAVLRQALEDARVAPHEISYVETHGTGTALGDPIEVEALAEVIGHAGGDAPACMLGAVKTNVGHLEAAAGIAGVIKTVLALHHGYVPPNLHFYTLNPHLSLAGTRFALPTEGAAWTPEVERRCAGVSSFGFGGTNAHIVLEGWKPEGEASSKSEERGSHRGYVLPLTARSKWSLRVLVQSYGAFLNETDAPLRDVCFTAAARRTHHEFRFVAEGGSRQALVASLDAYLEGDSQAARKCERSGQALTFVFSGQGAQWAGMGRELLEHEPVFRAEVERIDALLRSYTNWSVIDALTAGEETSRLAETEVAQPAIFAFQVGLAALWKSWGIEPEAVVGHSVGEVTAAYVGGALRLEDAVRLIYHRGRLMQQATGLGTMAAVGLPEDDARALLNGYEGRVAIAAVNGPASTVLSGEVEALEEVLRPLADRGTFVRKLPVNYAFHSPQVAPFGRGLGEVLGNLQPQRAAVPIYSTVSARREDGERFGGAYWTQNVNEPVRFAAAIQALAGDGYTAFLEIGPHAVLSHAMTDTLEEAETESTTVASMRRGQSPFPVLRRALGTLVAQGYSADWNGVYPGGRPVPLPAYPWQRSRFWLDPAKLQRRAPERERVHPLLGARLDSPLRVYESALNREDLSYLSDHRIFDTVVLPMAAFLEMVAAAARDITGATDVQIDDVIIQEPLVMGEGVDRTLQTVIAPAGQGRHTLQIFSRPGDAEDAWVLHVTGTVAAQRPVRNDVGPHPNGTNGRFPSLIDRSVFYEALNRRGSTLGTSFRTVEEIKRGSGEALGQVRLPEGAGTSVGYTVHPTLLDGALQILMAAVFSADELQEETDTYLPFSVDRFCFYRPAGDAVWSRAEVHAGKHESTDVLDVNVEVWGEGGEPVARIDGLKLKRASREALLRSVQADLDEALYRVEWKSQDVAKTVGKDTSGSGRWLVFSDSTGTGTALAEQLGAQGEKCTLVEAHTEWSTDGEHLGASPYRPEDIERVLEAVLDEQGGPIWGIVHLWSLDAPADMLDETGQRAVWGSALHLAQAVLSRTWPDVPRLWFVTRGGASVHGDAPDPCAASLWGFRRSLDREHPELRAACIDLDPYGAPQDVGLLLDELQSPDDREPEVAFRARARFVPRLTHHAPTDYDEPRPVRLEIKQRGVLDNLAYRSVERRTPGPGEVEVRVLATGLNFRDVLNALGTYPGNAGGLGSECAGVVAAVGEGVAFERGAAVFGMVPDAFGTYAIAQADLLVRKPVDLSFTEAATIPITFLTAAYALYHLGGLRAGERVLIHAAAGGVGMAAVQLALRTGAEVFGTAGSPEKRALLTAMGVHHVMDSRSLDFADEIQAITNGKGVDVVLNSLTGDFIDASVSVLAPDGRFLEIGKTDIWDADRMAAERPEASYCVIYLGDVTDRDPALVHALFSELLKGFEDGSLTPLPHRVFPTADVVDAFRYMAQARHIGKVVVADPMAREVASAPIRTDASYLVTGGLGGLGLRVVRWLVDEGARHVAVVGRSAPNAEARAVLGACEAVGARVLTYQGDVSERQDVERVLRAMAQDAPPLAGIVHAAGVRDDGLVVDQALERIDAVMKPKVGGAWHLHEATKDRELDFFVLFAAAAGLTGNPGQAGYTAANAMLDALAHYRHARGLPALSVDWGAWGEVGMVAEMAASDRQRLLDHGFHLLSPDFAVETLGQLLRGNEAQVAVLPMHWRQFVRQFPDGRTPVLFEEVVRDSGSDEERPVGREEGRSLLRRIEEALAEDRPTVVRQAVQGAAARILGLDVSVPIDGQKPLRELGLDSLMAVELRNALSALLETRLSATLLFDYPTLDALVSCLCNDVLRLSAPAPDPAPNQDSNDLAALSDEEAEALLVAELTSLNKE